MSARAYAEPQREARQGLAAQAAEPWRDNAAPADGAAAEGPGLDLSRIRTHALPPAGAGRSLEPETRREMESGFGRDFAAIRIHDGSRDHDNARALGALAYAAGNDIVFGRGQYAPQTGSGRALIAHELAHSVQQGGVQMKREGALPTADDAGLEAEADAAALAVTAGRPPPSLSRIGAPAVFCADPTSAVADPAATATPAAGATASTTAATTTTATTTPAVPAPVPPPNPPGIVVEGEEPAGTNALDYYVCFPKLLLPEKKGSGPWVQETYDAAAKGGSLIFCPELSGPKVRAIKEAPDIKYRNVWLKRWGFTKLPDMATAFLSSTDPEVMPIIGRADVATILAGFKKDTQGGCDIDHIVEKQLGGGSIGTNLQLLLGPKNQQAGRVTYEQLKGEAEKMIAYRPKVARLRIRYQSAEVKADTDEDASYQIERLLRANKVTGSAAVAAAAAGAPVALLAGGKREIANVVAGSITPIDVGVSAIISGLRLKDYVRKGARKPQKGVPVQTEDEVTAELASQPMIPDKKDWVLIAKPVPDTAAPAAAPSTGAAAATPPATTAPPAMEARQLTLPPGVKRPYTIPYLSPGVLTEVNFDAQGRMSGKGTLKPTLGFLGPLDVDFAPNSLVITKGLAKEQLKSPADKFFRFTESSLSLQLAPNFVPSGTLAFSIGPEANPMVLGKLTAAYREGAFVATGLLTPGGTIPGIEKAEGKAEYNSNTGWSGSLSATPAASLGAKGNIELGFAQKGDKIDPYAKGEISTQIRDSTLTMNADWDGNDLSFGGKVKIPKPFPLVKEVTLGGTYKKQILSLWGQGDIEWQGLTGKIDIGYVRKPDDPAGKFSGEAKIVKTTPKYDVDVGLKYSSAGKLSATGSIAYQVTKDLRPKLGVAIGEDGKIKMTGGVQLADISFGAAWPKPPNDQKTLIKAGVKFRVPTPVPAVTAFLEIKGSLGVKYGVGPVMLKGVQFTGSLYPFEPDPQIEAKLTGALVVPAFGEIYGTIGAFIGVEFLGGAISAKGGIEARPALRVDGECGLAVDAQYKSGAFAFSAEAYAKGQMMATLAVDLKAVLSAGWEYYNYEWVYNVSNVKKKLGPELKIVLGRIAYSPEGGMTWPDLSQIKVEPEDIDAMSFVKDLMADAKDKDGTQEPQRK